MPDTPLTPERLAYLASFYGLPDAEPLSAEQVYAPASHDEIAALVAAARELAAFHVALEALDAGRAQDVR